jgi:regulator of protease activity HflC (stomatin/prohibitin superfamily)
MANFPDADSYDDDVMPEAETRSGRWFRSVARVGGESANRILVIVLLVLFVAVYYAKDVFITIRSGEVGVLYHRFGGGTVTDRVLGEGMKIIPPWDKIFIYNVRVQETKQTMDVLTSEGLTVKLSLSIRYHPELDLVGLLQSRIGPDYKEKIVIPEVESALRTTMGNFGMEVVYGSQRGLVQQALNESLEQVEQKFVKIDNVVLRGVELPPQVRQTIEEKMSQKEVADSYTFRLDIAKKEAERRQIEAGSLKAYNDTLNSSLTPSVLKWEGIQATKELAKSPNAKTIVIGAGGASGLPIILGGGPEKQP